MQHNYHYQTHQIIYDTIEGDYREAAQRHGKIFNDLEVNTDHQFFHHQTKKLNAVPIDVICAVIAQW